MPYSLLSIGDESFHTEDSNIFGPVSQLLFYLAVGRRPYAWLAQSFSGCPGSQTT
jgi:hypothetical protein